jgi:hypothetical protein
VPAALNQRSGGKQNGVGAMSGSLMQRRKGGGSGDGVHHAAGLGRALVDHRGGRR